MVILNFQISQGSVQRRSSGKLKFSILCARILEFP